MKKLLIFLGFTVICILGFAACSESSSSSMGESYSYSINSSTENPDKVECSKISYSGLLHFRNLNLGTSNSAGYYEIVTRPDGVSSLVYTDFESRERIVLCDRPECTHDNETCTAFVGKTYCLPVPIAQENRLILLYTGWPAIADNPAIPGRIEVRNLDGSNPKTVVTFGNDDEVALACATDDENWYGIINSVIKQGESLSPVVKLVQINLTTGEMNTISDQLSPDNNNMVIGAFDQCLLLKRISVSEEYADFFDDMSSTDLDDWNAMIASQTHEIYYIDDSGQEHILASWKQNDSKGFVIGENCFLYGKDGNLSQINLKSNTEKNLATFTEMNDLSTVDCPAQIGEYLIIDMGPENYIPGQAELSRFAINISSGEKITLTQKTNYQGVKNPIQILAQCGQELLVISDIQSINQFQSDSYDIQYNQQPVYSLISTESFLDNGTKYTELSTIS